MALDRSGSIRQVRPLIGPAGTVHSLARLVSTVTPASASMAMVISICGMLGSFPPVWRTVIPLLNRAPASSKPETNWEDPEASISTVPPVGVPTPSMMKGRASPCT